MEVGEKMPNGWIEYKLGEVLSYEQPTPFIVESTDYDDKYLTPVLTAGKSFIKGHTNEKNGIYDMLPVIIFDDFTTATQYVNFKFKVKSSAMKILTADENIALPKIIYYKMQIIECDHSTHKRYWIQTYSKIKVALPSIPEQKRIIAKIEELFSELDKGVEVLRKTKIKLEVYRQAVLKDGFEGKLTKQWREEHNLKFNWNTTDITKICKKEKHAIKAGPFGSALKKETYVENGYKIYGQEQVIAGDETIGNYFVDENKFQELINCKVVPNDILISLVGTVGKVLILSKNCKVGIINPRLIKISINENIMFAKFFEYYFESSYLKSLYKIKAHGATMDVLNLGMIKQLPFPICTVDEQIQVILEIESRLSVCDNIEQIVDDAILKAESLRQSILKKAFSGKLLPHEEVKND